MSEAINKLVAIAKAKGFVPEKSVWTKTTVFWFDGFMPVSVREVGQTNPLVEYFESQGTPHNPVGEGFIDRAEKVAISFNLEAK